MASRRTSDEASEVILMPVEEALDTALAFDHRTIFRDALDHIRLKILTTTIAKEFLPEHFTISELYQVIRAIVPTFEECNFIRKITTTQSRKGILEEVRDQNGQLLTMSNRYSQRTA